MGVGGSGPKIGVIWIVLIETGVCWILSIALALVIGLFNWSSDLLHVYILGFDNVLIIAVISVLYSVITSSIFDKYHQKYKQKFLYPLSYLFVSAYFVPPFLIFIFQLAKVDFQIF
jgi:hypothetical protein